MSIEEDEGSLGLRAAASVVEAARDRTPTRVARRSVLVIGGGLSGLAAAAHLADRGVATTLIEQAPTLGGRLTALVDPRSGTVVERWPSLGLDLGGELRRLLQQVGGSELMAVGVPAAIPMLGHDRVAHLGESSWPGFLKAWPFVAGDGHLGLLDRLRAVRGLAATMRAHDARGSATSYYRYLRQIGLSNAAIGRLWNPLCQLATGLPVEEVAAEPAHRLLYHAFVQGGGVPRMVLTRPGFARRLEPRIVAFIGARGGSVVRRCRATRLVVVDSEVRGVEIGGEIARADAYVAAVGPRELLDLLPERCGADAAFSRLRAVRFSPLTSVHLRFDRTVMPWPAAMTQEGDAMWLVHRPATDSHGARAASLVSVYLPGSARCAELSREEVVDHVRHLVHAFVPTARGALVEHALVVRHDAAHVCLNPGSHAPGGPPATALSNLWIAGSWHDPDLPGSLEGAVRSGTRAAAAALQGTETGTAERPRAAIEDEAGSVRSVVSVPGMVRA